MRVQRDRKEIGKEITQWRKARGLTVATGSSAPTIIANLQGQLYAARRCIEELEETTDEYVEEIESLDLVNEGHVTRVATCTNQEHSSLGYCSRSIYSKDNICTNMATIRVTTGPRS